MKPARTIESIIVPGSGCNAHDINIKIRKGYFATIPPVLPGYLNNQPLIGEEAAKALPPGRATSFHCLLGLPASCVQRRMPRRVIA
jgi:hypothetical protein